MRTTYDGYEIADKDLLLRGPGDFISSNSGHNIRQSGGFKFKLASACDNAELLESAFSLAKEIIERDPELSSPENLRIKNLLSEAFISASTIS